MTRDDKDAIDRLRFNLRTLLESRRDYFVVDEHTLMPMSPRNIVALGTETSGPGLYIRPGDYARTVSAASLRLVLDWCENDFAMSLESFLSGMFHGKEWDGQTPAHQLIPEAKDRISADSLGLGHLYPQKAAP